MRPNCPAAPWLPRHSRPSSTIPAPTPSYTAIATSVLCPGSSRFKYSASAIRFTSFSTTTGAFVAPRKEAPTGWLYQSKAGAISTTPSSSTGPGTDTPIAAILLPSLASHSATTATKRSSFSCGSVPNIGTRSRSISQPSKSSSATSIAPSQMSSAKIVLASGQNLTSIDGRPPVAPLLPASLTSPCAIREDVSLLTVAGAMRVSRAISTRERGPTSMRHSSMRMRLCCATSGEAVLGAQASSRLSTRITSLFEPGCRLFRHCRSNGGDPELRCGSRFPHVGLDSQPGLATQTLNPDSQPRLSTQTLLRRTASVPRRLLGAAEGEKPCPIDLEHNLQGTKALHGDQPATTRPGRCRSGAVWRGRTAAACGHGQVGAGCCEAGLRRGSAAAVRHRCRTVLRAPANTPPRLFAPTAMMVVT